MTKCLVKKKFCQKKIFSEKKFGQTKFLVKKILVKIVFGLKKFPVKKIFWLKKVLVKKIVGKEIYVKTICDQHDSEREINDGQVHCCHLHQDNQTYRTLLQEGKGSYH